MKDIIEHVLEKSGVSLDQVDTSTLIGPNEIDLYVTALNFTVGEIIPETMEQLSEESREKFSDVFTLLVFVCFQTCLLIGRYRAPEASGTFVTDADIEFMGLILASHPNIKLVDPLPSREEVWKAWHTHPDFAEVMSKVTNIFRDDLASPESKIIEARNFE
jgi:hypothetical protein